MRFQRSLGKIAAGVLLLALAAPSASRAGIADRIRQKQAELHRTRAVLSQKKDQLTAARLHEQSLQEQLTETNASIVQANARLSVLSAQVHQSQKRLAWNTLQLHAAEATLERHNLALRRRLVDAYEHGELGYLNVLLASTSFTDFVERWDDIRYLIASNERAVRERQEAERRVAGAQRSLERENQEVETALERQREAESQLAALAQTRQGLLIAAANQRREVAQQVVALEEISAQEESTLESLIVERQKEEEARREAERRAALLAGKEAPSEPNTPGTGGFNWPASGPITSPFGYRSDPYADTGSSEFHTGLDIGAPMGSTVTATASGTVIYAAWYGGYGNAVIIDHGNGVSSLYGHLSQIFVSDHQEVQQGQAIGAVGSTGRSTGPHLHFEIRVNGQPVDPASRLQ